MSRSDGLREFGTPEAQPHVVAAAPTSRGQAVVGRHLWVIGLTDMPYAIEECEFGRGLETGIIKHTNLTGGADAHCGGEAWFLADDTVIINGSSGRYGPVNKAQLDAAALAFKACGYKVASMGFDDELGEAPDIVVGQEDLEWI